MSHGRTHVGFPDPVKVTERPRDPVEGMLLNEAVTREAVIAHEEIIMLRQKVQECYFKEGVNHLENCKDVVAAYRGRIQGTFPEFGALQPPKD